MLKSELIAQLVQEYQMPLAQTERIVEALLQRVTRALVDGDRVELRGFGVFRTKERARQVTRSPKTGARQAVSGRRLPHFRATAKFITRLNPQVDPQANPQRESGDTPVA